MLYLRPKTEFRRVMTKTIAVVNQKGGVGKTTTAINVGAQLAAEGMRVLLVDLDPQGNATSGLGLSKEHGGQGTYDVLCKGAPLKNAMHKTHIKKLSVLPANSDLAGAEVELVGREHREFALRKVLEGGRPRRSHNRLPAVAGVC